MSRHGIALAGEVVEAPVPVRHHFFDYEALFYQLGKLEVGRAVCLPMPDGINFRAFDRLLRAAGRTREFNVSIRRIGSNVYLSQRVRPSAKRIARTNAKRDEDIVAALANGETKRSLADKFGISHQRVHQIEKHYFVHGVAVKDRHGKMLEFADPYLAVCDVKQCVLCDAELPSAKATICKSCKQRLKEVGRVRTMLAYYKKSGHPQSIRQAVYQIRKHNISPEEIGRKPAAAISLAERGAE